jgi:hypothetical protein
MCLRVSGTYGVATSTGIPLESAFLQVLQCYSTTNLRFSSVVVPLICRANAGGPRECSGVLVAAGCKMLMGVTYANSGLRYLCWNEVPPPNSKPHTLTSLRPHALGSSRPHTLTSLRPHTLTSLRPHTLTSLRPHTLTSLRPHTLSSLRPHTLSSLRPHTLTSLRPHTLTSLRSHTLSS